MSSNDQSIPRGEVVALLRAIYKPTPSWGGDVATPCCRRLHIHATLQDVQEHATECLLVAFCERHGIALEEVEPGD